MPAGVSFISRRTAAAGGGAARISHRDRFFTIEGHPVASNADIRVDQIAFPPTILCNCPTSVKVTLINRGNAAPVRNSADGKFEVCLQSSGFQVETGDIYRQRVGGGGEQPVQILPPGQTLVVTFTNVVFRRAGSLQVTACADCAGVYPHAGGSHYEISNDRHTQPCLKAKVDVIAAAWLRVDHLEIDLEDSLGNRSRNVAQLCPGGRFVAVATVSNRGCLDAQNVTALLTILDPSGNLVAAANQVLPVVPQQMSVPLEFHGAVPVPNAFPAAYAFRVCLDFTNRIQPQCSRQFLCLTSATIAVVRPGGPGPAVTFFVNGGPIFPGSPIPITWGIQDDCSDLGDVTARVTLKATGDLLYDSGAARGPIPVPPLTYGGEGSGSIPPAVIGRPTAANAADALYQVGDTMLHIEITGTGRNPGPYVADTRLTIAPESVDASWWTWDPPGPCAHPPPGPCLVWKSPYNIGGTLTNRSQGAVTFSAPTARFTEYDDDAAPPAPTGQVYDAPPSSPGDLTLGATVHFVWPNIIQDWAWLLSDVQGAGGIQFTVWRIVGPMQKDFGYEAAVALSDEFGNAYVLRVRLDPDVVLYGAKWADALEAVANVTLGIGLVLAGLKAADSLLFSWAAPALMLLAVAAFSVASVFGEDATDPPVPDFDYLKPVPLVPPKAPDQFPAEATAIRAVLELLGRIAVAFDALRRIERKVLGARIDGSAEGVKIQTDGHNAALNLLTKAAAQFPNAVAEAIRWLAAAKLLLSEAVLNETLAKVRQDGLPDSFRGVWVKAGLPENALPALQAILRSSVGPAKISTLEVALRSASDALDRVVRNAEAGSSTTTVEVEGIAPA
jgi:hypothetical protein